MIDIHTHILGGMDDGAPNSETSLQMLRAEREQGVDTVVLTPHFYRHRETPEEFLRRRDDAMQRLQSRLAKLPEEEQASLPRMLMGAEVAWVPNLHECPHLDKMCLNNTEFLLLELPYARWDADLVDQIYDLMTATGLTPVLAHLDRYRNLQPPQMMSEMLELELPIQLSAESFLHVMSRRGGLNLLKDYGHVLASDCHDVTRRRPNLGDAMAVVRKKLDDKTVKIIDRNARTLVGE